MEGRAIRLVYRVNLFDDGLAGTMDIEIRDAVVEDYSLILAINDAEVSHTSPMSPRVCFTTSLVLGT